MVIALRRLLRYIRRLLRHFQFRTLQKLRVFSTFFAHRPTPTCPNKRISTMGVSPEQYAALKNASERFLAEEDFSYPHTTELMKTVFGSDCASPEALAWAKYWTDLGDADEKMPATSCLPNHQLGA
ncbi:hypothetical protein DFH08DRAFT_816260 [Mycena albidolilacea]|uniref:Uncharacterized protein n=1 Tax=Mycena albidolilacea TaxID=1033008 RepID=A0AAD6ZLV5_9AGAR|nr:hypothetical protein DFH08DRAFT_816260 [Mycena albidolilacea]